MALIAPDNIAASPGAYVFICPLGNQVYVGSTNDLHQRMIAHKSMLSLGNHHNKELQSLHDSCSGDLQVVLHFCVTRDEAYELEQKILDGSFQNGWLLNIAIDVRASTKGLSRSLETKEKIRVANLGKSHTQETREKMSISRMGKVPSQDTREKIGLARRGKVHSDEAKEKIRANTKGVNSMSIKVDGIEYSSSREAAEKLGVSPTTVFNRLGSDSYPTWKRKSQ
jgi:group I intron endonuclease